MTNFQKEELVHYEGSHGTVKSYIVGFGLSIILTLIAFSLVMHPMLSKMGTYAGLITLAILQLFIQTVFFLHLNMHPAVRWRLISFIFSLIIVCIIAFGSLWIMANLNYNVGM